MNILTNPPARSFTTGALFAAFDIGPADHHVTVRPETGAAPRDDLTSVMLEDAIDRLRDLYRRRNDLMGADNFGDPRWQILLAVAQADINHDPLSTTDCAIVAGIPTTTTIRTLRALENDGLVRRIRDTTDLRRIYVHLTGKAMSRLVSIFRNG